MKKTLIFSILLFVFGACGEEENDSSVGSSKNLSVSDFSAEGTADLDDGEIKDWIAEHEIHENEIDGLGEFNEGSVGEIGLTGKNSIFSNFSKTVIRKTLKSLNKNGMKLHAFTSEGSDMMKCMFSKLSPVSGGVGYFEILMEGDVKDCFSSMLEGQEDYTLNSFSMSFFMRSECDAADYSLLDGFNYYDYLYSDDEAKKQELITKAAEVTNCKFDGSEYRKTSSSIMTMSISQISTGNSFSQVSKEALFASDSGPCKFTTSEENTATISDCTFYAVEEDSTSVDGTTETSKSFFEANLNGVVGEKDKDYYSSGSVTFKANSSTGSVEFTGSSMPSFSVTHNGDSLSGYLSAD